MSLVTSLPNVLYMSLSYYAESIWQALLPSFTGKKMPELLQKFITTSIFIEFIKAKNKKALSLSLMACFALKGK